LPKVGTALNTAQVAAHERRDAVIVDAVGPRRVLRQPQRVSRRGRHRDGFRDISGVEQTALAGIAGMGPRQTVGLQLERVARCRCEPEERFQVMAPLMSQDHNGCEVANAPTMRGQPHWGVVDRFVGRTVEGQVLRTSWTTCRHNWRPKRLDGWCTIRHADRAEDPLPKHIEIMHDLVKRNSVSLRLASNVWYRRCPLSYTMPEANKTSSRQTHDEVTSH
jgi:hypothetical protein